MTEGQSCLGSAFLVPAPPDFLSSSHPTNKSGPPGSYRLIVAPTFLFFCNRLIPEGVDHLPLGVQDGHLHRNTAVQAVRGAAQSGVVGAYGHLHLVQDALVIGACLDELLGRLVDAQVHGGVIVG